MGKKHHKGKNKAPKIVLSLAEFNENAGIGGIDPELAALPSAPKTAEDWDAEGGRPQYNSRGYKERKSNADADFEKRDLVRKGPIESEKGNSFGMGGPDRDRGGMRRCPVDGPEGRANPDAPKRNWNDMRRGTVESGFEGASSVERDWGARKGPVEAKLGKAVKKARVIDDSNWGSARVNAVDAQFPEGAAKERDWGVHKGPVEAEAIERVRDADWTARNGPVESEFTAPKADRDWTQRKGPVESVAAKLVRETDWTARKDPIAAEVPDKTSKVAKRDWSARRGPVATKVEAVQKAGRDIGFGEKRRGVKLQELKKKEPAPKKEAPEKPEREERWRRDTAGVADRKGPVEARERPASPGHEGPPKVERDWAAARLKQPVRAISRQNHASTGRGSEVSETPDTTQADRNCKRKHDDDDWTTVRSAAKRRAGSAGNRRFSGRGQK